MLLVTDSGGGAARSILGRSSKSSSSAILGRKFCTCQQSTQMTRQFHPLDHVRRNINGVQSGQGKGPLQGGSEQFTGTLSPGQERLVGDLHVGQSVPPACPRGSRERCRSGLVKASACVIGALPSVGCNSARVRASASVIWVAWMVGQASRASVVSCAGDWLAWAGPDLPTKKSAKHSRPALGGGGPSIDARDGQTNWRGGCLVVEGPAWRARRFEVPAKRGAGEGACHRDNTLHLFSGKTCRTPCRRRRQVAA